MTSQIAGVIAVHNQVRYARESVLSLRPEVDELVVVDDGSSDGSRELLRDLARSLDFELIEHREAVGVSETYNEAVQAVSADVILIQGGDDRSLPLRGARSALALEDPAVSLVHSLPIVIDANGAILPDDAAAEFGAGASDGDPIAFLYEVGNCICAPSVAVRRADYLAAGGFPAGIDLLQDYALWLELAARGRFQHEPEPLVEYRKHGTNLSREYTGAEDARRSRYETELRIVRDAFLDRADETVLRRLGPVPGDPDLGPVSAEERRRLLRALRD